MSYNNQKPDAGPSPALDASTIQGNFADYANIFADNHVAMNQFFQGNHTNIIFETQSGSPSVTTNLALLFARVISSQSGSQPELFVKIPQFLPTALDTTVSANSAMRLTYSSVGTTGPPFYSFLPGGYVIYWGNVTGTINAKVTAFKTVTLSPVPTKIIIAIAVPNSPTGLPLNNSLPTSTNIINNSTFRIYTTGPTVAGTYNANYNWFAIGTA